jgi:DNA recombination protein RmuC
MEFLAAAALGLAIAVAAFLILQRNADRADRELSALISGVKGEERLRTLEAEMRASLGRVTETVAAVDQARGASITRLETVIEQSQQTVTSLQATTSRLADTLSNSQARGQWGERMAEDILRAAGFIEDVNYRRNRQFDAGTGRPDYSFLLPEGRILNMDVKFPIASYVRYLDASSEEDASAAEKQFLADVRGTVASVAGRDYIDPSRGTLDFMLVFIPNENIYAFIHERDPRLADDALQKGVVLCSPLTLFALLSVIRQAADAFALAHAADEVLTSLGAFNREWQKYSEAVATVGRRIESLQRAFDDLSGPRTRVLERQLQTVEQVRLAHRIELPESEDDGQRDPQTHDPEIEALQDSSSDDRPDGGGTLGGAPS